ncbi:MAG: hypothetical protein H0X04_00335 [Chthoniobacterales bacterium]|nr:hypothetical protein [Chthoniobacterales bacterium]
MPSEWLSIERMDTLDIVWLISADYGVRFEFFHKLNNDPDGMVEAYSFVLGAEPLVERIGFNPTWKSADELRRIACEIVSRLFEGEPE